MSTASSFKRRENSGLALHAVFEEQNSDISLVETQLIEPPLTPISRKKVGVATADVSESVPTEALVERTEMAIFSRFARFGTIAFIAMCLSFAYFYKQYNPQLTALATKIEPMMTTAELNVTAIDPELAHIPDTVLNQERDKLSPEIAEKIGITLEQTTKDKLINTEKRTFTYVQNPRYNGDGGYVSVTRRDGGAASQVGKLGLRPIPNSDGRYVAQRSDLQWQGGWDVYNPNGNAERGASFLKYLNKNFSRNMGNSLSVKESGKATLSDSLSIGKSEALPILKHTK